MNNILKNANKKAKIRQSFLLLVFAGSVLIVLGIIGYRSYYNKSIINSIKDIKTLSTEEALKDPIIAVIDTLYELPEESSVTVGTIANIKALQSKQKYFEKAKNGDILLIYPDKTIIYDPINKTLVDVATVKLMK